MSAVITIDDTNYFQSVSGGGYEIEFAYHTELSDEVALAATDDDWDTVRGGAGIVSVDKVQVNIIGGDYTIVDGAYGNFDGRYTYLGFGAIGSSTVELYGTGYAWDQVFATDDTIVLNSAQANVTGAGNTITLTGTSDDIVELYQTGTGFDSISGTSGLIALNAARADVSGGDDTIEFVGASGNAVSLSNTNLQWDTVYGSNGAITLTGAEASVFGGGDWITLDSASAVAIYATANNWDQVNGSGAFVTLYSAESNVIGGGDTIILEDFVTYSYGSYTYSYAYQGPGSVLEIYGTAGNADNVYATQSLIALNDSQATVFGDDNTIDLLGSHGDTLTLTGTGDFMSFAPSFGTSVVNGFGSDDGIALSASDFADWTTLQQHMNQSGADVVIALDASNTITLKQVDLSSLTSSQFHFV